MPSMDAEVKIAVGMLHTLIEGNYISPYTIVEMMTPELRDHLGHALYAHSANQTALSEQQTEYLVSPVISKIDYDMVDRISREAIQKLIKEGKLHSYQDDFLGVSDEL